MAITAFKTFAAFEVLTASDLNASFSQIINNPIDLWSPMTKNAAAGGFKFTGLGVGGAANEALTYGQALVGTTLTLSGAISGVTTISLSGAISGGTGFSGSGQITTTRSGFSDSQAGAKVSAAIPCYRLSESDGTSNAKHWLWYANAGVMRLAACSDDDATTADLFAVTRSQTAIATVTYGNNTDNPTHTFEGATTFNDAVTCSSNLSVTGTGGNVAGTTWTPTLTGVTNVTGTPTLRAAWYERVGATSVQFHLVINVVPTAANSNTEVGISVPIASNFANDYEANGDARAAFQIAGYSATGIVNAGSCIADTTNDRITFRFLSSAAPGTFDWYINGSYRVI